MGAARGPVMRGAFAGALRLLCCAAVGIAGPGTAASFEVGTFTKSVAAPGSTQVVPHGLGAAPKALLVWSSAVTNSAVAPDATLVWGMTDTSSAACLSVRSTGNSTPTQSHRLWAAHLLSFISPSGAVTAQADYVAGDATSFTLQWPQNDATPALVHYLAVSGPEVGAHLSVWQMYTDGGSQTPSGFGFSPSVVFNLLGGTTDTDMSLSDNGKLFLGVADDGQQQWTAGFATANAVAASSAGSVALVDACLAIGNDNSSPYLKGRCGAMQPDGMSVSFPDPAATPAQVATLGLGGVRARAGWVNKTTAPAPTTQSHSGLGFAPQAMLLAGMQGLATGSRVADARLVVGGVDSSHMAVAALYEVSGAQPSSAWRVAKPDLAYAWVDGTGTMVASAMAGLGPDGFTLSWEANNGSAADLLYVALASLPDGGTSDAGAGDGGGSDAGVQDAGPADGGASDAGRPDAGSAAGDAGADVHGRGGPPWSLRVGCGCGATWSPELLALAGVLLWSAWARRRRL